MPLGSLYRAETLGFKCPAGKKQANNLAEVPNSINHNFLIPDAFSDNLIALGLRCFPVIKKNLNVFSLVVNDLTEVCDKQKRDDTGKERNDELLSYFENKYIEGPRRPKSSVPTRC